MSEYLWTDDFAKPVLERLRAKVGDKVQKIVFTLQEDLGRVQIQADPSLILVWGGWVVSSTDASKSFVRAEGDVRFATVAMKRLEAADPLTTKAGSIVDGINGAVTKWLLGWRLQLPGSAAFRVKPVAQIPFTVEDAVVILVSEWRIERQISEDPEANAP